MWDDAGAMGRLTRRLLVLVVLMLIGAAVVWLYNSDKFPVRQIAMQGKLTYADSKELGATARSYIKGNIFRADIAGAQEALQKLPWIDSAMIRRRFPDTVEIQLVERIPVARWGDSGLVDTKGNVFKAKIGIPLPVFEGQPGTGKDMVGHYREFSEILARRQLKIRELVYTPRSAWLVKLDNGIVIRLGRENEIKRLQQFAEIWPGVLRQQQNSLSYVDMRYKDGFSVRYKTSAERPSENRAEQIQHQ